MIQQYSTVPCAAHFASAAELDHIKPVDPMTNGIRRSATDVSIGNVGWAHQLILGNT